ncbi:MAG: YfaP family protein [Tannerellaceae bacterium]|jgi:hypothetical protein|nr:YfaP family protein [Tannerellaceae bacterium]
MRKIYSIAAIALIAIIATLAACNDKVTDDTEEPDDTPEEVTDIINISGHISLPANDNSLWNNCSVISIGGESKLVNGEFELNAYANDKVQTFIVQDNDNVYLMGRTPVSKGQNIEIGVRSTAITMVTLHPLFSPVGRDDYQALTEIITGSSKFQALYNEVEKTIRNKRNLYDETNEDLLLVFSDLMEDLCGESADDEHYDKSLDEIEPTRAGSAINTRAIFEHSQINPTYINAQINRNSLSLRTMASTPSYYGTIKRPDGSTTYNVIPSRSDFGVMDFFTNNTPYGDPMNYDFFIEGNYIFNFSRISPEATLDFYMRIAGTILSALGLPVDGSEEAIVASARVMANAIAAAGSGVSDARMSAQEWLGIAYNAALAQLSTGTFFNQDVSQKIIKLSKTLASSLNWYNKIKGAANLGLRLTYAFGAPETIDFCLCYYNNEITTCTETILEKANGDEQTGYAKQRLLLPLTVYITTIDEDGIYYQSGSYNRVKFEVVSGGGKVEYEVVSADNNNQASTYWTLGEVGDQIVRATVVDIITGKEISDPVYFTASLESAKITIRLDWSRHSGYTDIDLHVVDPYGEEIAFYNMASASGGYLDRDDVVGPGPEHVRWSNAPVGTYKIYVHYYPNEDEDRSVTSYKVSVTADGVTYRPKTGSIAYDQFIPVGQITIGGPSTRSVSVKSLDETESVAKKIYPKK